MLNTAKEARKHTLGVFHPTFSLLQTVRDSLLEKLPEDAHVQASGKLCVSLTRLTDGKNVLVSEFESREELIQVKWRLNWFTALSLIHNRHNTEHICVFTGSDVQLLFPCLLWFYSTFLPWSGELITVSPFLKMHQKDQNVLTFRNVHIQQSFNVK